jgi:hypothetical protein
MDLRSFISYSNNNQNNLYTCVYTDFNATSHIHIIGPVTIYSMLSYTFKDLLLIHKVIKQNSEMFK